MSIKPKKVTKAITPKKSTSKDKLNNNLAEAGYEDIGFRSIGSSDTQKNLTSLSRNQQLKLVFNLFIKNGFAKRLLQLPIEFIVGATMFCPEFKSKDDKIAQETLDECSDIIKEFNEKNKFANKFDKFALDLALNGMLLLPCINNDNGDVTVGFIDPAKIQKVITNPYDVTDVMEVKMKSNFVTKDKIYKIIRKKSAFEEVANETVNTADYDLLTGDAFYCAINNVSNQPEGISDLLADIDLIQKLYDLLINVIDSTKLANMFVLDTTIEGADPGKIKEWKKNNPIPDRATRFVHNDKVKQNLMGTNIRAFNSPEVIRVIRNFVLGNSSYPPMWFADGEDANKATAVEQGTPVYKKFSKRQELLVGIIKDIYLYVIHTAVRQKEGFKLTKDDLENLIIEIKSPEIQIKNLDKITTALKDLTESLAKAEVNKWLTSKTTRKSFISFINLLGFDINQEAEEAALSGEEEIIKEKTIVEDLKKDDEIPPEDKNKAA